MNEVVGGKEFILRKLDEEHLRYRTTMEQAFNTVESLLNKAVSPIMIELAEVRQQLASINKERLSDNVISEGIPLGSIINGMSSSAGNFIEDKTQAAPIKQENIAENIAFVETHEIRKRKDVIENSNRRPKRIRWGETEDEIKQTVFNQLRNLENLGKDLTITTIKTEVPGMLRYVYGDKKLFQGIGSMLSEYRGTSTKTVVKDEKVSSRSAFMENILNDSNVLSLNSPLE